MAFINVNKGQTVANQIVTTSDFLQVNAGGTATDSTVNGGFMQIYAGGTATGIVLQTGPLEITNGTAPAGTIIQAGSFLTLYSGAVAKGVKVGDAYVQVYPGATLSDVELIGHYATVDFAGLQYITNAAVSLDPKTDVLTIAGGGVTETVQLVGDYTGKTVGTESDMSMLQFGKGQPGTTIYLLSSSSAGTLTPTPVPTPTPVRAR